MYATQNQYKSIYRMGTFHTQNNCSYSIIGTIETGSFYFCFFELSTMSLLTFDTITFSILQCYFFQT